MYSALLSGIIGRWLQVDTVILGVQGYTNKTIREAMQTLAKESIERDGKTKDSGEEDTVMSESSSSLSSSSLSSSSLSSSSLSSSSSSPSVEALALRGCHHAIACKIEVTLDLFSVKLSTREREVTQDEASEPLGYTSSRYLFVVATNEI